MRRSSLGVGRAGDCFAGSPPQRRAVSQAAAYDRVIASGFCEAISSRMKEIASLDACRCVALWAKPLATLAPPARAGVTVIGQAHPAVARWGTQQVEAGCRPASGRVERAQPAFSRFSPVALCVLRDAGRVPLARLACSVPGPGQARAGNPWRRSLGIHHLVPFAS